MYRRDPARSNFTATKLPVALKPLWNEKLGGSPLTQAVAAYGLVCATEPQTHRVLARDAATGKELWSFIADGRVDVPPALHKGLCLFGTSGGSVYALDARTGKEVWRMRAAPAEKYIAEEGQFASAWPVIGGIMPMNGEVFFTCGRSASADGGMWIFAADAATGKIRWRTRGGSSGDMFTSDGKELMLTKIFYHLANGSRVGGGKEIHGLLRTTPYLTYVSVLDYMACVEPLLSNQKHIELTDGRITGENLAWSDTLGVAAWRYRFGVPKDMMKKEKANQRFIYAKADGKNRWLLDEDIKQQMVGVVLAGGTAYFVGVPTSLDPNDKSELWVISVSDGKKLQTLPLDAHPVYDGLSAAAGRLYLTTEDGRLICFGLSAAVQGKGRTLKAVAAWWKTPSFNALDLIGKNRAVLGVHLGTFGRARPALVREWLAEMFRLYEAGKIKPYVGKTFPLAEAARAHEFIHDRQNIGKVLLLP